MKKYKGFTLVELLVVIAIIGLLSTLAVVALSSAREKARDARRISDIRQIQTGLELYFADMGTYPQRATAITLGESGNTVLCNSAAATFGFQGDTTSNGCTTTYLGQVPKNFENPLAVADYQYTASAAGAYSIAFELEGPVQELVAGAHTATQAGIQ